MLSNLLKSISIFKAVSLSVPSLERVKLQQRFIPELEELLDIHSCYLNLSNQDFSNTNWLTSVFDPFLNDESGLFVIENLSSIYHKLEGLTQEKLATILLNILDSFKDSNHKYLLLVNFQDLPFPEYIEALIPTFNYPLPNADDIAKLLSNITQNPDPTLINSVSGLSETEIELGLKLVTNITDVEEIKVQLLDYKQSRLKPLGLEFIPNPDVGDFGGMERLKRAIDYVAIDYSEGARLLNIPYPKGWLLAGPPGTGKTFCAKVCATKLGFPLISVGVDVVKSKGAGYLKRLLQRIEMASPALCYFDEFDKFFDADTAISGGSGTSKETLGVLLTWLQEKQTQTFVIATLNRLDALPPELTRAGRFDKIWYVGFPQAVERKEIFQLHASRFDKRYKSEHGPLTIAQWKMVLNETNYCTGAEIRAIVEMSAKQRFYDDGVITLEMQDFIDARKLITPLYIRDTERVLAMENRARGVAEPASEPDNSLFANVAMNIWGETV